MGEKRKLYLHPLRSTFIPFWVGILTWMYLSAFPFLFALAMWPIYYSIIFHPSFSYKRLSCLWKATSIY